MRQRPGRRRIGGCGVHIRAKRHEWSQQAFLKPSNRGSNDWFGSRLALNGDGNIAVIGASLEDSNATGTNANQKDESAIEAGAAYLFTRTGTTWQQQAYIKGSNTEAFDEFGGSIALNRTGAILVVTAPGEDGATHRRQWQPRQQLRGGCWRRIRLRRDALTNQS